MSAGTTIERYGATVTTVDVPNKVVEFALKTADARRFTLATYPTVWTWPQVGDQIMVRYENGQWNLEGWFDTSGLYQGINPGDTVINAPTGTIYVVGENGFTITKNSILPATKPVVTGSKAGNAALASLITALADLALIDDTTT